MIISVIGTRPQYIKYAAIDAELKRQGITDWEWVDTKQHYDDSVSKVFYEEFNLPAPYWTPLRDMMRVKLSLRDKLEWLIKESKPDMVIVYGDTDSTLAGALAAKRCNIPLAHVESGRRSGSFDMPEETNRIVADALADLKLDKKGSLHLEALSLIDIKPPSDAGEYYLMDLHRNFNIDNPKRFRIAIEQAQSLPKPVKLIYHHRMQSLGLTRITRDRNIEMLKPQSYTDMIGLIKGAIKVITDSGGVQREAYQLRVPCITVRPSTEWGSTLAMACNVLVEPDGISRAVTAKTNPVWGDFFSGSPAKDIIKEVQEYVESR